ncbi:MAG: hypothetical protein F6K62_27055 [Sphaerospermopsis sp. SIO1G2]|nr:hypothetical protein [Sphaerospermopsis sp. SIO1G2]
MAVAADATDATDSAESTETAEEMEEETEESEAEEMADEDAEMADDSADGESMEEEASETAVNPNQLNDDQVEQTLEFLLSQDEEFVRAAFDTILDAKDTRFVSVLIELLRASQLGITPAPRGWYIETLERL